MAWRRRERGEPDPDREQALRSEYWAALTTADRHRALGAVRALHEGGLGAGHLVEDLVVPAQQRIGELWLAGRWSIAQEHAATAVNEGLVHWLYSATPRPPDDAPLVVVSCVPGERHALPALVVAEGMTLAGLRVHYAGADPEPTDLLRQVAALGPLAVLLSASLNPTLARAKALVGGIRALGVPVVLGGRALAGHPQRAVTLGATAHAGDVPAALRVLAGLPARSAAPAPGPVRPAEDEGWWIVDHAREVVPMVLRAVSARRVRSWSGSVAPAPEVGLEGLAGHVGHLLGSLAAALVTDDETILVETRDWLTRLLRARGADDELVAELWSAVARPLRSRPLARVMLERTAPGRS